MPTSTKKPSKKLFSGALKKRKAVIFFGLAVLLLLLAGAYIYRHKQDQNNKVSNLSWAQEKLDSLKTEFEKAGFEDINRTEGCYKTSVKNSEGWNVCEQALKVNYRALTDSDLVAKTLILAESYNKDPNFSDLILKELSEFDKKYGIARSSTYIGDNEGLSPDCRTNFEALNSSFGNENRRNTFEFAVWCSESHLDKFIYPETK